MPTFVFKCDSCGAITEDLNPSPPLCPNGHGLMKRKFTPPFISCSNPQSKAQESHEQAYYQEQDEKISKQSNRVENNKAIRKRSLRKYAAADMHNRHGHGIEELDRSARKIEEMK